MSKTIDERVVEMRFDNKQFESNVQTSLGTLDRLKKSLNLDGAAKSLSNLDAAGKKFSLSGIAEGVETISSKFSALGIIGVTALQNIVNKAVDVGSQLVKSFTIEPIMQGFGEYELKMGSIQTMMMSTGASLSEVNGYLNELNTYADKTIYSFSDMTSNIGKFTNAGVGLKESVMAIQGVSNAAAVSGANANEASRAMYNFAQALSSGCVRLIDWKSIENANMATVEFKNELIKTAVELGTLTQQGDKYISTTTDLNGHVSEAFNATSMFNDSLSAQWMTTDVLVETLGRYADETTEIGKKAFAAAQEVKTFSQLMDTLKEAVGSGWAMTFEILLGDFNEAKELWTGISEVVGGMIDAQSDARNAMLQEWKDLGGRKDVIESLTNVITGLASVLKPIGQAWKEIFPPMTGKQLAEITTKIKDLTANFKISDEISKNLKDTFKGLFSVLDLGKQGLGAIIGFVGKLLPCFDGLGGGILSVTGSLGRWVTSLNESARDSNTFATVLDILYKKFADIGKGVKEFGHGFSEGFKKITNIDLKLPTLEEFLNVIDQMIGKLPSFTSVLSGAKTAVEGFFKSFTSVVNPGKIGENIGKLIGGVFDIVKQISSGISESLGTLGFDSLLDAINGGMFATILFGIRSFIKNLTEPFEGIGDFVEGITGVLDGVKDCLKSYQSQIRAEVLLKIAGAIAVLTAAIVVLSTLDAGKTTTALVALGVMFAELLGSMAIFQKVLDGNSLSGMGKVVTAMLGLSAAILILTGAMKSLAGLDMNQIAKGLIGIAGLSAILVTSAKKMSEASGKLISGALGLVIFAQAIKSLSKVVGTLGKLDTDNLIQGLIGVGVLVTELALFLKKTDLDGMGVLKGIGLLAFAGAMNVLALAVEQMGTLDTDKLIQGLLGVGAVLTEMGIFINAAGNSKHILSTAVGLLGISTAMNVLATAMKSFGSMKWDEIARGLTAMAGALASITIATRFMPNNLPIISVGLIAMGAALNVISESVLSFGTMKWDEIAKGLITLAGALAIIAVATNAMTSALPGAAAMLVLAAAISVFTPAIMLLGTMSFKEIGAALLVLAGAFTVVGIAGYALGPVTPIIIGLSAALLMIGTAVTAVGVGIAAFGVGAAAFVGALTSMAAMGAVGAAAVVEALKIMVVGVATLIPDVATAFANGIIVFAETIAAGAPVLASAAIAVVDAVVTALVACVPKIASGAGALIEGLLQALLNHGPEIISTALQLIAELLVALGNAMPTLVDAGIHLMTGFINGMAQGIRDNTDVILSAVKNLVSAIIEFVISALQEVISLLPGVGKKLSGELEKAKEKVRETLAPESFAEMGSNAMAGADKGIASQKGAMESTAASIGEGTKMSLLNGLGDLQADGSSKGFDFVTGLMSREGDASSAGSLLTTNAYTALTSNASEYGAAGTAFGTDFATYLANMQGDANISGKTVTTAAETGLKSNSPVYAQTGTKYGSDFSANLSAKQGDANTAGRNVTTSAEGGLKSNDPVYGQIGSNDGTNFANGISSKSGDANSAGVSLANSGVNGVSTAYSGFESAGRAAGDGFIVGMGAKAAAVARKAAQIGRDAVASARAAIDSHSPSKEFMKIGEDADRGMIIGLENLGGAVTSASGEVGSDALNGMKKAISQISDIVDMDVDFAPTIRPVIDLSDIQNGTGKINRMMNQIHGLELPASVSIARQTMQSMNRGESTEQDRSTTSVIDDLKKAVKELTENPSQKIENTFHIKGDNPKEIAEEVSRIIQRQVERRSVSWA